MTYQKDEDETVFVICWTGMDGSFHEEEKECTAKEIAQYATWLEERGAHSISFE